MTLTVCTKPSCAYRFWNDWFTVLTYLAHLTHLQAGSLSLWMFTSTNQPDCNLLCPV